MLEDAAREHGIDLNAIDAEDDLESETQKRERLQEHPAAQGAHQYLKEVNDWFKESGAIFEKKEKELNDIAALEIPNSNINDIAIQIHDFINVIRWYKHLIPAKIVRAIRGKLDDFGLQEDPIQNDPNGSAKVALIGIERSIAAWGGLLDAFPEKEDSVLEILVLLEKIRPHLEAEFPKARKFIRAGFDE